MSRMFPGNYYHFIPIPNHNDPEFCSFTYGEVKRKVASLTDLRRNDVLVLYAGFERELGQSNNTKNVVGIFAYLVVKKSFLYRGGPDGKMVRVLIIEDQPESFKPQREFDRCADGKGALKQMRKQCKFNPHGRGCWWSENQLIVCGNRKRSRLLTKVEILAECHRGAYVLDTRVARTWGLKKRDLTRSSIRSVEPRVVEKVFERLKHLA